MAISYAGVSLVLEDPDREYQQWLERALSLKDLNWFGPEPLHYREGRDRPRGNHKSRVGLAVPNWIHRPPRWRLNTLWWPCTGAARFAQGLFLASDTQMSTILSSLDADGAAVLEITDEQNGTVSTLMHLLPARRANSPLTGLNGWILPLVDERYWWQWLDSGNLEVACDDAWTVVINALQTRLGVTINYASSILSNYFGPDPVELTRRHENAAVLLDAVAACLGTRVVRRFDGAVILQDFDSAASVVAVNLSGLTPYATLAGGAAFEPESANYPNEVKVVFPRCINDIPQSDGDVYTVTRAASLYSVVNMTPGTTKVFYTTAPADFTAGLSTPANIADMTTLADKIADDYYASLGKHYDHAFDGVYAWTPNAYDDWVWVQYGNLYEIDAQGAARRDFFFDDDYQASTRVCSLPYDFGVCELLHAFACESSSCSSSSCSRSSQSSHSSSSRSSISTSGSSSSFSSKSTSGSSSSSCSSSCSSSSGVQRCIVYGPTAVRREDFICIPKLEIWVDPVDLVIKCRAAGEDCVYVCCDEEQSSSSRSTSSSCSSTVVPPGGGTSSCCPGVSIPTTLQIQFVGTCDTFSGTLTYVSTGKWRGTLDIECGPGCPTLNVRVELTCCPATITCNHAPPCWCLIVNRTVDDQLCSFGLLGLVPDTSFTCTPFLIFWDNFTFNAGCCPTLPGRPLETFDVTVTG